MSFAIGGFADLSLFDGDRLIRARRPAREVHAGVVRRYACETCGAQAGEPCTRPTIMGNNVVRGLPHFDRAPPLGISAAFRLQGNRWVAR